MIETLDALAKAVAGLSEAYKAVSVALYDLAVNPGPTPPDPPTPLNDYGGYRPHYQGHGTTTKGGRGGVVLHVRNGQELADAVARDEPRVIVFDASGNYTVPGGQLAVVNPYLTIAGQTAPDLGVTLVNTRLLIDTHDVVVQHLKVRQPPRSLNGCSIGDAGDGGDNSHVYNVVFDHITCTWSNEVNNLLVAGPGSHDVAILDSLIGEALWPGGLGGIGAGVGYKNTVARSIFTQHWSRQPIWGSPAELALYNNISYNGTDNSGGSDTLPAFFGDADGEGNPAAGESTVVVNNVLIAGPNSGGVHAILGLSKKQGSIDAGARIYLEGNQGPGITGPTHDEQWKATVCVGSYGTYQNAATCGPSSNLRANTFPDWWVAREFNVMPTNDVFTTVLQSAGARPKDRDVADVRMINDIKNGTGTHFLDSGNIQLPDLAVTVRVYPIPIDYNEPGSRTLADGSKNTVLEDVLESDAQRLEVNVNSRGTR